MSEGAESRADVGAMIQRRRTPVLVGGERELVLGVREAMQQRRVLRKKQRGNQQQGTKPSGHLFFESTTAVKQPRQRQSPPGSGSIAGSDAHQQGSCPVCMPQRNGDAAAGAA